MSTDEMSKGKLAVIIATCVAAVIVTVVLVTSSPLETPSAINDYASYVVRQCTKAAAVSLELKEMVLDEELQPHTLEWTDATTTCMEQLEQIRVELTATPPPESSYDKYPGIGGDLYETALGVLDSLTGSTYLLLQYAHAKDRGDAVAAGGYLTEFQAETERLEEHASVLLFLVTLIRTP